MRQVAVTYGKLPSRDGKLPSRVAAALAWRGALSSSPFLIPINKLNSTTPLLFNGCILSLNEDSIALRQKGQGKKIDVINVNSPKQGYIEQRARGAYVASICQPKASFDLSVAA
jgi:hypothetical protein